MDDVIAGLIGAAVGAGATALASWLSSRHRTRGAIRDRAIEITEALFGRFQAKDGTTARQAADAASMLIVHFVQTIDFAEGRRPNAPQLPKEGATMLDETVFIDSPKRASDGWNRSASAATRTSSSSLPVPPPPP